MKYCVLASGSKGNSLYIETHHGRFLIDVGLSAKKIADRLASRDIDPAGIAYQLINTDAAALANSVRAPLNTLDYPVLEFEMARLKKRSLANLHKRILSSIDVAELGTAFRYFDWSLESMLNALDKSSGKNLFYQKLKLANAKQRAYFNAAIKSRDRGDCEWADETMAKALAVEGKTGSSNLRLAQCYAMHDRYREALAAYAGELEIDPGNTRIHTLMARIHLDLERAPAAYDHLRQVAVAERGAAYHYLMAQTMTARNDEAGAERHYAEAVAMAGSLEAAADSVRQLTVQ